MIPDEAIEAAADTLQYVVTGIRANARGYAKAALEAAMPAIREALAQEIKAAAYTIPSGTSPKGIISGRDQAARIVRGGAV
jgi:streptogramin lyase